ncbi:DUF5703 domain-containing protein [uncultured Bacteroides sp.]|mgnify:CR=1 FL=1|uniref:DUF5703 domain-containing protein n=1 Tax=uncultured Bacteroides sp. TaxID=162156 RepID=UPI002638C2C4|nr:DUF5703 domain-containing protein [uncultured Bacteroides sp.]
MKYFLRLLFVIVFICTPYISYSKIANSSINDFDISQYNVVWNSMSKNSSESMPCGGGDIGTNVWVENGELMLYLSKSGAFEENGVFPKLGRVRLNFSPSPFENGEFRQELHLDEGYVSIWAKNSSLEVELKVWVDVFNPVVHIDVECSRPVMAEAVYENWKYKEHKWTTDLEYNSSRAYVNSPYTPVILRDSVRFEDNQVLFYHRNKDWTIFDMTVRQQGLDGVKNEMWNPLQGLTFGGCMFADNMYSDGTTMGEYAITPYKGWKLQSKKENKNYSVKVILHAENTDSAENFVNDLMNIKQTLPADKDCEKKSRKWWNDFFKRSYIAINTDDKDKCPEAWQVGRNYNVFRYQMGCNAYGRFPTKFNGGLFTFDPCYVSEKYEATPDHRDWGGVTFTAQNQRLLYWPMLKSGDFDMMASQLDFYLNALKNAELRTKVYWGHGGASFTEQMEMFGLPVASEYGWDRPSNYPVGVEYNKWLEYLWDTSLEFCMMAMDKQRFNGDDISRYIPLIDSCLDFFFLHYQQEALNRTLQPFDGNGKLVIYPGSGAETYKVAYNASSTVAALHSVLGRLLELPEHYLTPERRNYWKELQKRIPDIPLMEKDGHKIIAPAVVWHRRQNHEMSHLYPVYPWGIYGIGKPGLDIAINTWKYGAETGMQKDCPNLSWHQDAIFCARMGLTNEAEKRTIKKLKDSPRRFPTFWGPGHDWVPDHNWGGSGMIGLQEMLMQTDGEKIYLFPAWPKEWNVVFKLHAPYNTIVEGELKDGEVKNLKVTPKERLKDMKNMLE